jgi:hypothetical protein
MHGANDDGSQVRLEINDDHATGTRSGCTDRVTYGS